MKSFFYLVLFVLTMVTFRASSQPRLDTSNYYLKVSDDYLLIFKGEQLNDSTMFFLIKSVDTSGGEIGLVGNKENFIGLISHNIRQNGYKILASDNDQIDSIWLDYSNDGKLRIDLFKSVAYRSSKEKSIFFDDVNSKSKQKDSLKITHLNFTKNNDFRIPFNRVYYDNFKIFNFKKKQAGTSKALFHILPCVGSDTINIDFKDFEAIVIVDVLNSRTTGSSYYLAYLKPKTRTTEGLYTEYEKHLWIDEFELFKNFKYQK